MQDDERLNPIEAELETALSGLKPAGGGLDRDRLMFLAGRASMHRRNHLWQVVCVLLAALLLAALAVRPRPGTTAPSPDRMARDEVPIPAHIVVSEPYEPIDPARAEAFREHVRLRRAVLERGLDGLPASTVAPAAGGDPATARQRLHELLSAT